MAIFASTTLGTSDPSRAMSIKALEARAQALAAANAKQEIPQSVPSPWQGMSNVFNTAADAFTARRADQAAAQRRQDLAGYIAKAGDNPTAADIGQISAADPEFGKTYLQEIQQRRSQAATIQAQKEMAAQKAEYDKQYLQQQETLQQGRPQTDIAKLKADLDAGRMTQETYDAAVKKLTQPSPGDQDKISKAQTENIDLQASQQSLDEALRLLGTGKVYSDSSLAQTRTEYGQSVPKVLQGIAGVDPESTDISKRYDQIMKSQVMPILNKLKGSMSNADREFAITTINNPSATKEAKEQVLRMLKTHMDAQLKQSNINLQTTGNTAVKVEPFNAGASAAPAAPAGGGDQNAAARAWLQANPNDPRAEAVRKKLGM